MTQYTIEYKHAFELTGLTITKRPTTLYSGTGKTLQQVGFEQAPGPPGSTRVRAGPRGSTRVHLRVHSGPRGSTLRPQVSDGLTSHTAYQSGSLDTASLATPHQCYTVPAQVASVK